MTTMTTSLAATLSSSLASTKEAPWQRELMRQSTPLAQRLRSHQQHLQQEGQQDLAEQQGSASQSSLRVTKPLPSPGPPQLSRLSKVKIGTNASTNTAQDAHVRGESDSKMSSVCSAPCSVEMRDSRVVRIPSLRRIAFSSNMDSDRMEETSMDISYGPGFVSRLKSRYLTVATKSFVPVNCSAGSLKSGNRTLDNSRRLMNGEEKEDAEESEVSSTNELPLCHIVKETRKLFELNDTLVSVPKMSRLQSEVPKSSSLSSTKSKPQLARKPVIFLPAKRRSMSQASVNKQGKVGEERQVGVIRPTFVHTRPRHVSRTLISSESSTTNVPLDNNEMDKEMDKKSSWATTTTNTKPINTMNRATSSSMVFNFLNSDRQTNHIVKQTSTCSDISSIAYESEEEEEEEDSDIDVHRPVSPCKTVFVGANAKTGKKSSIRSKKRSNVKMNITFSATLIRVHEYDRHGHCSNEDRQHHHNSTNEGAQDNRREDRGLRNNGLFDGSSALATYTPSRLGDLASGFQLGVTPSSIVNSTKTTSSSKSVLSLSSSSSDEDTSAMSSWSTNTSSVSSDLLF